VPLHPNTSLYKVGLNKKSKLGTTTDYSWLKGFSVNKLLKMCFAEIKGV